MNKDLQNLIKLSKIDKEATKLEPQIAEIEDEVNIKIKLQMQSQDELESLKTDTKRIKLEIANNELLINENSEKLAQIDKKIANVKSEYELRALDAENGLAKEKIAFANEEISRLEKELEAIKDKEKELLQAIELATKDIEETKIEVQKKTAKIKLELQKIFDSKEKLAKSIDNKVLVFYEKIRKWAKDTSVVVVKKQACSGCFIRINDKVYSELLKSDDIVTCPHCGRILYIQE
ncbi:hypothetical protein CCY99_00780 [Helicobacter sp. 16-1353]|uniref:zinc ribbon domain-containing protein n=1 Tax=Helicobacter sp. 16-1353 TaxID=2004996 RepID=UPI000DCEE64C|nr:C4-type zinc ribbon domain-containing protein [Helicobacter sp. 16-1353]RAX55267.1 hypothetical protein CCY99_00780 [Helicobacter sp. 16-1353]